MRLSLRVGTDRVDKNDHFCTTQEEVVKGCLLFFFGVNLWKRDTTTTTNWTKQCH